MPRVCLRLGWETYPRQAMPKVLLNQVLHLAKKRERLSVMHLGTPSARRRVRLLEKLKAMPSGKDWRRVSGRAWPRVWAWAKESGWAWV